MKNQIKAIFIFTALMLFNNISVHAQWGQIGAEIIGDAADDRFGSQVSYSDDGTTVAIGSWDGYVKVYKFVLGTWIQQGSTISGFPSGGGVLQGVSLNADGTILAYSSPNTSSTLADGSVRVFKLITGTWIQQGASIMGDLTNRIVGGKTGLSDDGLTLAVGFRVVGSDNIGKARVYSFNGTSWSQIGADITTNTAIITGSTAKEIALSGDGLTVAIGLAGANSGAGQVAIYKWLGSTWVQQGGNIAGEAPGDTGSFIAFMGLSLNSDGQSIAIGATGNDGGGSGSGHTRIFKLITSSWAQQGNDIDGEAVGDRSGGSVSISNDGLTVAIGAIGNSAVALNAGHVRVYQFISSNWIQKGADIDGQTLHGSAGWAIGLSGDGARLAIGTPGYNGTNGSESGKVEVYNFCSSLSSTDIQIACNSYTWIDGNTYTSSNNTATYTLTNSVGCDSVITLDLTISTTVNATTTTNNETIIANQVGAIYQWVDCTNGLPIVGATSQSYTATANGNYSVLVSLNGCSDTSSCIAISTVGISENSFGAEVVLFPNPTTDFISLKLGELTDVQITITDLFGKVIYTNNQIENSTLNISIKEFTNGAYLLSVNKGNKKRTFNVIKQL